MTTEEKINQNVPLNLESNFRSHVKDVRLPELKVKVWSLLKTHKVTNNLNSAIF